MNKESPEKTKRCSSCHEIKPLSEFYDRPYYTNKKRGQCKDCMSKNIQEYKRTGKYPEWCRNWYLRNIDKKAEATRKRRNKLKLKAFEHYGGNPPKCACCGETMLQFLTIDHIEGKGAEHRRKIGTPHIYGWLVKNDFPEGFQVLCWNCNWGRRVNNGVCPHKTLSKIEDTKK